MSFLILDAAAIPGGGPDDMTHCVSVACTLSILAAETMQAPQCLLSLQRCTLSRVLLKLAQDCFVAKSMQMFCCKSTVHHAASRCSLNCTLTGACIPPNPMGLAHAHTHTCINSSISRRVVRGVTWWRWHEHSIARRRHHGRRQPVHRHAGRGGWQMARYVAWGRAGRRWQGP